MTTEPYTPSLSMMRAAWKSHVPDESGEGHDDEEFDRFIAKIKADALRSFADELEANLTVTSGSDDALTIGVLRERADDIEGES